MGNGLQEEQMDTIFDPFFISRPIGEGCWLGFSLSFMIVQNHGGMVEVESNVGAGSTFRVSCRHTSLMSL